MSVLETLDSIYNGSYAQDLRGKHAQIARQLADLRALSTTAQSLFSGRDQAIALIQKARNTVLDASQKLTEAQNKYNFIVSEIGRLPGTNPPPTISFTGLSGLGALPAAVVSAAVVGGAIAAAATALAVLVSQIGGAIRGGDGYIAQAQKAIESAGGAIEKTGNAGTKIGAAAIGIIAVVAGFMFLKKRGGI